MLNITFGDMFNTDNYIYNTDVISSHIIESPFLGAITPYELSGGVKTLLLMAFDNSKVFNASTCGNNCARWILKIAQKKKLLINLRHIMDFGSEKFKIKITNTNVIVHNMSELVSESFAGF